MERIEAISWFYLSMQKKSSLAGIDLSIWRSYMEALME